MFANLLQDVRYGFRVMRKNPVFTLVAVLTLALGIGANTMIFSLVNGILLRPLSYPNPDRLVRLLQSYPEKSLDTWRLSQANFATYRDQNQSFETLAGYSTAGINLTGLDNPQRLQIARVTADFFDVLGVSPALGRSFTPQEDVPGKNTVCILSYGLWQQLFGGDAQILGKTLILNGIPTEVVGVMPASFKFPGPETELWSPLGLRPGALNPWFLTGVGRLKPGVAYTTAQIETTSILWKAGQDNPQMISRTSPPPPEAGLKTLVVPLKDAIVGKTENQLLILQIAVAFVLLIACVNVANLLLSRANLRTHEIALRVALGATPGRVIRQLVTESVLLALIGAGAGLALAWWCPRILSRLSVDAIPRMEEVTISGTVLLFTVGIAVLTGLLFGLAPALRAYRLGLRAGLTEGQRGNIGSTNRWMNGGLVAAQLALSLVLLIGAGLMLKSFERLVAVNPGFDQENVLSTLLPLAGQKYSNTAQSFQFYESLLEQVRSLPGVRAAAVTSNIPFSGNIESDGHIVEGQEPLGSGDAPQAQIKIVSKGYFETMGMSLKRGHEFQDTDTENSTPVAIVDETLANRYWADGDAVGKRIRVTGAPPWCNIVGVVSSVKDENLAGQSQAHIYFSSVQVRRSRMYLVVRTIGNPVGATSMIRDKIRGLDPDVPMYAVSTMSDVVGKTLNSQRLTNFLLTSFAVIALILAAIGLYGVMLVYVNSRTREFGIRLALGARPGHVLRSVLGEGLVLTGVGIGAGVLGAWALTRTVTSLLFEVSATDPAVFIAVPVVLVAAALLACYVPARRAARTDPMVALRYE